MPETALAPVMQGLPHGRQGTWTLSSCSASIAISPMIPDSDSPSDEIPSLNAEAGGLTDGRM